MATAPPLSTLRLVLRAANAFVLDLLKIGRGARDFTDALIVAAVYQANVVPLSGDLRAQQKYATFYTPPPDHIRRPISINAVASSLRLPFETVRRRVARLAGEGIVDISRRGVLFSQRALRSSAHREALESNYEVVRELYLRLKGAGAIAEMNLPASRAEIANPTAAPLRIVLRLSADYFLRMIDALTLHIGEATDGFVLMAVVLGNTREFPDGVRGGEESGPGGFVRDDRRSPVRAREVAAILGMPHETARRRLAQLVERGLCEASEQGFIVPASVLGRPAVAEAMALNHANLVRMFASLAELGVLALWDREIESAVAAA